MQQTVAFCPNGVMALDFAKRGGELPITHFLITAIILSKEAVASVKRVMKVARNRHLAGGSLHSKITGNNHEKQIEILEYIDDALIRKVLVNF